MELIVIFGWLYYKYIIIIGEELVDFDWKINFWNKRGYVLEEKEK